jgi:phosphohistidine phosphatase
MKTIYIVRHAKSSWDKIDLPDQKRPLMEKGKKRTKKVISYLEDKQIRIDNIISSPAVRAYETAKILAQGLNYPADAIKIDPQLYHAEGEWILEHFRELPNRFDSVMVVGHNPSLTDLANLLLKSPIENLPTSGVVCISFDADNWKDVPVSAHRTNFILFPKELPGNEE